jgi:hypothetical protein
MKDSLPGLPERENDNLTTHVSIFNAIYYSSIQR